MATRFHFVGTGSAAISPTPDASWELITGINRLPLPLAASGAFNTFSVARGSTALPSSYDVLIGQFISDPLAAQTIAGTITGIVRASENFGSADMVIQLVLRVLSNDGLTVRGTLWGPDAVSAIDSDEFVVSTLTNRKVPKSGSSGTLSSVTALDQDRLCVELGYRSFTSSSSRTGSMEFGGSSGSDCTFDQTSAVQNNPWIEFDSTISFYSAPSFVPGRGRSSSMRQAVARSAFYFKALDPARHGLGRGGLWVPGGKIVVPA